jgi:thiol:disulfide interchange protein
MTRLKTALGIVLAILDYHGDTLRDAGAFILLALTFAIPFLVYLEG